MGWETGLPLFRLKESIHVNAPVERCFLLSTSIDLVRRTLKMTPFAGKRSGLIQAEDMLWWRGFKFGLPAWHQTHITRYERPLLFQDTMGHGQFKFFQHDHNFQWVDGQTFLWDIVRFSMPFGPVGKIVGKQVVVPHVMQLLTSRFHLIKRLAEGPDWERWIPDEADRTLARAETPGEAERIQRGWQKTG